MTTIERVILHFLNLQIGIRHLVVFINKADLVDDEMLELVEIEMRELLNEFGFEDDKIPMVYGSAVLALKGDQSKYGEPSIHRLIQAMDDTIELPKRDTESPFLMPIDNKLSVQGRGTVIIGTVKRGKVKKNDSLKIMGFGMNKDTTISGLQVFKKSVDMAVAGDNVGINVRSVKANNLKKGIKI